MSMMYTRGVRGATTVEVNTAEAILAATREMLSQILDANGLKSDDVASAVFTCTPNLPAAFPAAAARQLGWENAALMDSQEMAVPDALPMCVRVLLHVNTPKQQREIVHIYLRGATNLRATVPPIR